jgi:hypothetical protein
MFFTEQSMTGQIIWALLFFAFILFYPRFMMYKMIADIEVVAEMIEGYTRRAVGLIEEVSKEKGGSKADPRPAIERTLDFFLIPPVDLDPYGILNKIEHLIDKTEDRLTGVVDQISPGADKVWRANTLSLLKGGIGLNMMAKIVRHYAEFVKKTKNLQIAMVVQMSLPLIKKVARAQMKGVEAIAEGKPIGDSIGPLVAAWLSRGCTSYEIARDVVCCETEIKGRRAYILKADGPGATLGKLGDAVKTLVEEKDIKKIITIDASLKLEGEKTGKVSEGIGAAIGDPGPEKAKMEEAALKKDIPLEALAIKMSVEEAISPLCDDISGSKDWAVELVTEGIERVPEGGEVVVVGVGNTCGIGNSPESVKALKCPKRKEEEEEESLADKIIKKLVAKPRAPPLSNEEKKKGG